ncbi:NAD(P)-binding protein [Biscogniauxia marginata]|nr:NAD(P)-binding protein [Biscogniauxia marginata]
MSKQKIFLVGATGETGSDILDALIEDGSFEITCFIRTTSAGKPEVRKLRDRGLKVVTGNLAGPLEETVGLLQGFDIVISAIFPLNALDQIPLIDAAARAGIKRFLPCNWGTPAARGIMHLRDLKEEVHDHIFRQHLGFTIIDVGFWYQLSCPRVPSGRFDYAILMALNKVIAGGTAPNMLIDRRDVGRITAMIIKDERTLNKRVYAYGDVLSQNEIHALIENKTGEKLDLTPVSAEEATAALKTERASAEADPANEGKRYKHVIAEYRVTKYVRADNTPKNAEYLSYINARELYPDYTFIGFADFVDELVAGQAKKPYLRLQQ